MVASEVLSGSKPAATEPAPAPAPGPAETASGSLRSRAIRGSLWTIGGYGLGQVLRLGSNLVLTRLLFPEAFGLMALVGIFRRGLEMFSDIGIGPAVLRHERADEPTFVNTAWTIQLIRGGLLCLFCCAVGSTFGSLYHEPSLGYLIPIAGLAAVITGFRPTKVILAQRKLQLHGIVTAELGAQAVGITLMLIWAYLWPSVWALVAGGLASAATALVLQTWLIPGKSNRIEWDASSFRDLMSFGKWIFLSSAIFFVSDQLDRALVGAYLGTTLLGVYTIGFMLAEVPRVVNQRLTRQVLYPALAQVQRQRPEATSQVFYKARRTIDLAFLPALGFIAGGGGVFVVILLYDPRYYEAGWVFQALCVRAALRCVLEPCETCLVALGYPRYATVQHIVRFVWIVVGIPVAWYFLGAFGIVLAVAFSELAVIPVLWGGLSRMSVLNVRREALSLGMLVAGLACGYGALILAGTL